MSAAATRTPTPAPAPPSTRAPTPGSTPPAPTPARGTPGGLDGRLEAISDGVAVGWAYDWSAPERRIDVDLLVDGELVASTTADMLRPTLLREGLGDGRHGFYVELPAHLRDGAQHSVAARFSSSCEPLPTLTPFQASASAEALEWTGTDFQAAPADRAHIRTLRQRPSIQAQFARRTSAEGFAGGEMAETIVLTEQIEVRRSQPLHFSIQRGVADPKGERRQRFEDFQGDYLAEPLLVSRLPRALVDTYSYLICPTERQFLVDSMRHPVPLPKWGYTNVAGSLYEREAEIEEREERVVALGAQANSNYSHWLVESVVRALLFAPFDDGSVMYLSPRLAEWQLEALALAGVSEERILMVPEHKLIRFREVFAVSRGMSRLPWLIPGALSALARLAKPAAAHKPAAARRRLFVSRALVRRRHITNEAELAGMLERYGFETVHPETLSLREQMELFAGAETVLGSWGSGLTSLIFSPPGTVAIELQPEDVGYAGNAFVWNIASIREQRFAQVVVPVAEGMRELPLGRRDMTVDVDHIEELLDRLLER
ncbi:MAG: glycosyltransferase family 61 protein [Solirubrobacterales bacterium]